MVLFGKGFCPWLDYKHKCTHTCKYPIPFRVVGQSEVTHLDVVSANRRSDPVTALWEITPVMSASRQLDGKRPIRGWALFDRSHKSHCVPFGLEPSSISTKAV
jgi:hypothetical protein